MTAIPAATCHACGQTTPRPHPTSDPRSKAVTEALSRPCDICRAKPGELCANTIRPEQPLPGRHVHHGRLENP